MKKIFTRIKKIITLILLITVSLFLSALFAINYFLQPQHVKNLLVSELEKQTHRSITINDFSWSIFPSLQFKLGDINISNSSEFDNIPLLHIKKMAIGVEVLPLLQNRLETKEININGLTLNLIQNKDGMVNWLIAKTAEKSQNKLSTTTVLPLKKNNNFFVFIPTIDINNININYIDEKNNQSYTINELQFHADHATNHSPFPFTLSMNISRLLPRLTVDLNAAGYLKIGNQNLQLDRVNFSSHVHSNGDSNLTLKNMKAYISNQNHLTKLSYLSANLYEGSINLIGEINSTTGSYALQGSLNAINLGSFLKDIADYQDLTGKAYIQFQFKTHGNDGNSLIKSLQGKSDINITQCEYLGADIGYLYRNAMSLILRQKFTFDRHGSITKIGHLTSSTTIYQGIATVNNLNYASPILSVTGNGSANLINQKINLKLTILGLHGDTNHQSRPGLLIPFTVTGPISNPDIQADMKTLLAEKIKSELNDGLKELEKLPLIKKIGGF